MSEWKEYRFSDFVNINPSVKIPKKQLVSFVEMKDLTDGQRFCKPSQERFLSGGSRFENGDTLFARITPCLENGKICQVKGLKNGIGFGSTEFHVFRGKSIISDSDFVYYLCRWSDVRDHAEKNFDGTSGRQRVPKQAFDDLYLNLPELSEQKSIASILSSLDDKIDLLHRQNATLEKMAETLFRQWFVEEAKEEWEEVELEKLIDVVIDNRGKTPPTVDFPTDYPLIEVNALNSNSCLVDYSVIRKYVNKETYDNWFRKHLKVNDIIISTVGTIGVFSIHLVDKGCIAQNLVGLRSNSISSYFIYNFFKTNVETLINLDIGGVQPSIKVPHLLGLIIKYPPYELLRKYDESVEIYFNKIAKNQTQIRTLTALRDTLLPKLMSGEVRVEN
ncbi:MAG: restriction endonuclease subunit S [Bacteroidales bacterium]|jgi:type I restriction enzyme S subunit|nr:restriction endonuclease subunit S [Bacteroidales bacterium]MDD3331337.1 restriction endonuclease subunit S [Bacteroidales bacterium]MDD4537066.1 restriction endonuclease subunit S [Petrimonas sp.]